ncbi:MAG: hypothetical protein US68_C0007G0032 [Candidatus Shapirobacteria bacterium GW2011_GWE1_38_10]|uniref:Amidohydrolase-related domain-containing protein n=1 Tax=Candidatus Shapirobacteria bacterium GW2011_GWE1_38_10 TaxID=1618488 RepID=A0A0G0KM54_9BACT|nr:MAG: hypothetical protein US46_C0007G0024 [Candidatus Shapirobacteria bacterium GW2011_GWF2_37_20]KKQ50269.1 MAG: hypothetical protein US68_C0007G0032 [Candidatus Shapirobacteria bacterium GW2011_GWE1_38_10]KKQ64803.1 MAG: hypothetical protein US85_C0003G0025 [Candidatus Shapirobacteria bacterium GW2011_GWF1_38_23]HBP51330.1 hypothetical protein [Candidatus Shapirobacteria bacterium]
MVTESFRKIDAHSHFGKSYFGPDSIPQDYLNNARSLNIIASVISPAPTPEIKNNELIFRPCIWKPRESPNQVQYVSQEENTLTGETIENSVQRNPYFETNEKLINFVRETNYISSSPRLMVMPTYHPLLDDLKKFTLLLDQPEVVAIKIHGIATFTGPESISRQAVKEIQRRQLPVVVHTDMYKGEITNQLDFAREMNHPRKWARWSIENSIPILLTHGARLDIETMKIIRNKKNIFVGCSPDLYLFEERTHSLAVPTNNFLSDLFNLTCPEQLVFDIDFGWNLKNTKTGFEKDWDMDKRIELNAKNKKIIRRDLENIYFNNASNFYKI